MKGKTLEEMSRMVEKFHKRIAEKKSDLAPIIKVSQNEVINPYYILDIDTIRKTPPNITHPFGRS